jgi:hypothetical protein
VLLFSGFLLGCRVVTPVMLCCLVALMRVNSRTIAKFINASAGCI